MQVRQEGAQASFFDHGYASSNQMFSAPKTFDARGAHPTPWPHSTGPATPQSFTMTASPWALHQSSEALHDLSVSASPTSFDNAIVTTPESDLRQYSDGFSSDQSPHGSVQAHVNWSSVNTRGSFDSSVTDCSVLDTAAYRDAFEKSQAIKPQGRRRRRNMDPQQRHADKLEKNRKAAERCRQKQRAYVVNLQVRAREEELKRAKLISQVTQLRDDILSLKENMVSHSGCNDERIKQYLLSELAKATRRRSSSSTVSTTATNAEEQVLQDVPRWQSG